MTPLTHSFNFTTETPPLLEASSCCNTCDKVIRLLIALFSLAARLPLSRAEERRRSHALSRKIAVRKHQAQKMIPTQSVARGVFHTVSTFL